MSIVLSALGVVVALFILGVVVVVAACLIEQWLEERRRRQLLADRALSEARIQLRTAQATQQLLDAARDSMASPWPTIIRAEQTWDEDDHG